MSFRPSAALWAAPFRPFFIATAAYAIIALFAWLAQLMGPLQPAGLFDPMRWHAHEMLFGMVSAAIAGFLLTAMATWTGTRLLSGRALIGLFALWLAGRLAMWSSGWLPGWLVSITDLAFLAVVAIYAGRVIWQAGSHRNLIVVGVVCALWLCNLAFHLGWLTDQPLLVQRSELAAIGLIVLLMVIIGGRITPAFTRNWLKRHEQDSSAVRSWSWLEWSGLLSLVALAILAMAGAPALWLGTVAGLAAAVQLLRLLLWSGWKTWPDPLMWILHLAYAWIPLGLGLMAWSLLGPGLPATAWLHALGSGAMGMLILAVMTRVALGHTGLPLQLPRPAVWIYLAILMAALLRLMTALGALPWALGLALSTLGWLAAFGLYLLLYLPILTQPRVDGKAG
jgi:uncharacterized protein involved in response to NO